MGCSIPLEAVSSPEEPTCVPTECKQSLQAQMRREEDGLEEQHVQFKGSPKEEHVEQTEHGEDRSGNEVQCDMTIRTRAALESRREMPAQQPSAERTSVTDNIGVKARPQAIESMPVGPSVSALVPLKVVTRYRSKGKPAPRSRTCGQETRTSLKAGMNARVATQSEGVVLLTAPRTEACNTSVDSNVTER